MKPIISVIIPSLGKNPKRIRARLKEVQENSTLPYEVILVDASKDNVLQQFEQADFIKYEQPSQEGRGPAMDKGAEVAIGEILVFLHEDTTFPKGTDLAMKDAINQGFIGGACRKVFNQQHWYLSYLTWLSDLRSKKRLIFFGDQLLFTKRESFNTFGGFRNDKLFEDVNLSKRMIEAGPVTYLHDITITTDASRIMASPLKYLFTTIKLKLLYALGTNPDKLFSIYYKKSS